MRIFPIFIPHKGCPFKCVYCNQHAITKSDEVDWKTILPQISKFCKKDNVIEYKEIAFFGGTFTALPKEKKQFYFNKIKDFSHYIKGIRISTRPDFISDRELEFLKQNKVSTIEIGAQSLNDDVLKISKRGYSFSRTLEASNKIKDHKFNFGLQIMPGLPGFSDFSIDDTLSKLLQIKPDIVRIYPVIVLKNTVLENLYLNRKYTPLTNLNAIEIVSKLKSELEKHNINVIKIGLHSDIDKKNIVAGPYDPSFGEKVRSRIIMNKIIQNFKRDSIIHISKSDISLFKGNNSSMLNLLKRKLDTKTLKIVIDNDLDKNNIFYTPSSDEDEVNVLIW